MRAAAAGLVIGVICGIVGGPAQAQTVAWIAFEDRNGNGIRDAGEPAIEGVAVEVYGTRDAGGAYDQTVTTGAAGTFSFAPGNGCYVALASDPPGWRGSSSRTDLVSEGTPGYSFPVGRPRFSKLDRGIARRIARMNTVFARPQSTRFPPTSGNEKGSSRRGAQRHVGKNSLN